MGIFIKRSQLSHSNIAALPPSKTLQLPLHQVLPAVRHLEYNVVYLLLEAAFRASFDDMEIRPTWPPNHYDLQ